jgi:hypothetical protein
MDNWRKSPPTGLSMLMDFECPFLGITKFLKAL